MIYLFTEYNRITDEDLNVLLEKLPENAARKLSGCAVWTDVHPA